jgi:type I restriction enzyme S subunit
VWKEVKKGYTQFQNGDVLLARITPSFENGKAGIAIDLPNGLGAGSTEYIVFRPLADALDPQYLLAYFKTRTFLTSGEMVMTGAVGQQRVPKAFVLESQLPLAPLNEQRRIAAKLDTTLAAVEACRQRLDGVAAILKRFRQAVLAAAAAGELTREWREGKEIAFDQLAIQDLCLNERYSLCIGPFGSNLKVSDYEEQGVPLVFVREIRAREFGGPGTKYVTPEKAHELIAHQVRPGDLLMTKMGDPPGDTAIYPEDLPFAIMTSDVVCIRPDPLKIDKSFLTYLLESPGGRDLIQGITAGVAQQKISLERLKTVFLKVPSLLEQQEIVRRAQALFTLADQLEARLTTARKIVDRLTPALLAKAFRGELVPQDPSDEPASELLARIRAARQADAGAGKPSRRGRPKAAANPDQLPLDAAPVPPDFLAGLLRECGALSERALLAVSELEPQRFQQQLYGELESGTAREVQADGQLLLEAVG